jgi:hypothetical protein
MRRMQAMALFTVGYSLLAGLSPAVAALPAFGTFVVGGLVLVRQTV